MIKIINLLTIGFLIVMVSCKRETLPTNFYGTNIDSFKTSFGGSGDEVINSIIQSSDGNYSFAGNTTTLTNGSQDVYVGQTDKNGTLLWSKAIGGASADGGCDIIETPDHNLLIAGYTKSFNAQNFYEVFLIETDFQGNILWQKHINDGSSAYKISLTSAGDGYIITGGALGLFSLTGREVYIAKISLTGDLIWSKKYSNSNDEIGKSFCYDNSGNMLFLGSPQIETASNDQYLVKTDSTGDSLWTTSFVGNGFEDAGNIINAGNNFIMCSSSGTMTNPLGIVNLNKIDGNGNVITAFNFQNNFPYAGTYIINTSDNNLLLTGSKSDSTGLSSCYLMKLDNTGKSLWVKTYGDSTSYTSNKVIETSDSYIMAGSVADNTGSLNAMIIKVKK